MRTLGNFKIGEGSSIENLTAPHGPDFPDNPNDAELFYRTETDVGLFLYTSGQWEKLATSVEVQDRHVVHLIDASSSPVSHTVPAASTLTDFRYTVKRIDASPNLVTFSADGATIEGDAVVQLYPGESVTLYSKNNNWYVI